MVKNLQDKYDKYIVFLTTMYCMYYLFVFGKIDKVFVLWGDSIVGGCEFLYRISSIIENKFKEKIHTMLNNSDS